MSVRGMMHDSHAWPSHGSIVPDYGLLHISFVLDYGSLAAEAVP